MWYIISCAAAADWKAEVIWLRDGARLCCKGEGWTWYPCRTKITNVDIINLLKAWTNLPSFIGIDWMAVFSRTHEIRGIHFKMFFFSFVILGFVCSAHNGYHVTKLTVRSNRTSYTETCAIIHTTQICARIMHLSILESYTMPHFQFFVISQNASTWSPMGNSSQSESIE